jgi:hypothetical protein
MERYKYPRTKHVSWSPGAKSEDKVFTEEELLEAFAGRRVVVSEKIDGQNCSIYSDGTCHARSIDSRHHESRSWVKRLAARLKGEIPPGWRVVGENLQARHSLAYENLPGYFLVFAIYDERNVCLWWEDTVEWCGLLDLPHVPVLYTGHWDEPDQFKRWGVDGDGYTPSEYAVDQAAGAEGYVVRLYHSFHYRDHEKSVAKYVRASHVQTDDHWMHQAVVPNKLKGTK